MVDIDAIKTKALRAVVKPDMAASLRKVFRWYSEKFATPLHMVERLPLEDILTAYFEDMYSNMEEPLLEQELAEMALTPAERAALAEQEDDAADDFEAQILRQIEEAEGKLKSGQPDTLPKDVSVKFTDTNLPEKWADMDPLAPPPKVK